MGRPLLDIKEELVEELAAINCTMKEIAAVVGCSVDTLENRFSDVIQKGRERGKMSLKRAMFDSAVTKGNVVMQIWLSKQMLGYTEKREVANTQEAELEKLNTDELIKLREQKLKVVGESK